MMKLCTPGFTAVGIIDTMSGYFCVLFSKLREKTRTVPSRRANKPEKDENKQKNM